MNALTHAVTAIKLSRSAVIVTDTRKWPSVSTEVEIDRIDRIDSITVLDDFSCFEATHLTYDDPTLIEIFLLRLGF